MHENLEIYFLCLGFQYLRVSKIHHTLTFVLHILIFIMAHIHYIVLIIDIYKTAK